MYIVEPRWLIVQIHIVHLLAAHIILEWAFVTVFVTMSSVDW